MDRQAKRQSNKDYLLAQLRAVWSGIFTAPGFGDSAFGARGSSPSTGTDEETLEMLVALRSEDSAAKLVDALADRQLAGVARAANKLILPPADQGPLINAFAPDLSLGIPEFRVRLSRLSVHTRGFILEIGVTAAPRELFSDPLPLRPLTLRWAGFDRAVDQWGTEFVKRVPRGAAASGSYGGASTIVQERYEWWWSATVTNSGRIELYPRREIALVDTLGGAGPWHTSVRLNPVEVSLGR